MATHNDKIDNIIEIRNLTTRFGAAIIHDNISLSMKRGELMALVGGSGSGKSTLLRAILVLLRPAAGSIRLFGEDVLDLDDAAILPLRRRMGVMFQNGALFSALTVLQNVCVPLREHTAISSGMVNEIGRMKIRLVGLPDDAAVKLPGELSGGMRKRAALARALALDPELIFLDEPTSGLDPIGAAALDELIAELRESLGLSVLMVTHDLNSLWKLADTIAVLGKGTIVACGPRDSVVQMDEPLIKDFFHGERGRLLTEGEVWKQK